MLVSLNQGEVAMLVDWGNYTHSDLQDRGYDGLHEYELKLLTRLEAMYERTAK